MSKPPSLNYRHEQDFTKSHRKNLGLRNERG